MDFKLVLQFGERNPDHIIPCPDSPNSSNDTGSNHSGFSGPSKTMPEVAQNSHRKDLYLASVELQK